MPKNYAHLLGFGRGGKAKDVSAEDDKDQGGEKRADDDQDDAEKNRERDREDGNKEDRRDQEDQEDDQRRDREDGDDAEDDQDEKKADDDTDDKKDDMDKDARAARGRERSRCQAIFSSKHAAGRPDVAAHLAFNTRLTRKEARGVLAATAKADAKGGDLRTRMAGMEQLRPGQDATDRSRSAGQGWAASAERVGITKRAR